MEGYVDAKDGGAPRAFPLAMKAPQAFLYWKSNVWSSTEWRRELDIKVTTWMFSFHFARISSCFNIFPLSIPNFISKLQLQPKRPLSYRWESPRLGFFPPTLPDGFHDHAGLPGPVPSLLCLCHGAALAVLPRRRCWGYESRQRRLLWHPVPARLPLPPGQTQTSSKHSPQLVIRRQQRTPWDAATHSLTDQTLREEKR